MEPINETLIRVQREWNGWHSAEVRLRDLEDVHWLQPNGTFHAFVHAYVPCTKIVSGRIPHDCDGRSAPHRLLVCVLKRHAIGSAYAELARRADERRVGAYARQLTPAATTGKFHRKQTA